MNSPKISFNLEPSVVKSGELEPVLEQVVKIVKYISAYPVDSISGDVLIDAAIHLAAFKATIGQSFAEQQHAVNSAEAQVKHAWSVAYSDCKMDAKVKGEKTTEAEAKAVADGFTYEAELEIISMKLSLDKAKNLRQDIGDMITTLQSRLGQLKQEMRDMSLPMPSTNGR